MLKWTKTVRKYFSGFRGNYYWRRPDKRKDWLKLQHVETSENLKNKIELVCLFKWR